MRSVAVTFDPPPTAVVRPDLVPPLLQPLEERVSTLASAGVDLVLVLPFTEDVSRLSPSAFVEEVLAGRLDAVKVIVGTNFRFGHRAAGDVVALTELGAVHDFTTESMTLLDLEGTPLSSTEIRAAIQRGDVEWAARALGRPWRYVGEVVRGDGRGRTIDVPTANVVAADGLLHPAGGVFVARAHHGPTSWDAVVNVGTRPTFDGTRTVVEAHLLDVDDGPEAGGPDLYGEPLGLDLLTRLRDERRFDGPDDLVEQIHADIESARAHLAAGV